MNVLAREFLSEDKIAMRRNLADAITLYGSDSTYDEDLAKSAILAGRSAFWSTAKYHSARACTLLTDLNLGMSFEEALEDAYRDQPSKLIERGLDTLIPLNLKAAAALSYAYSHHTGAWKDEEELLLRRVRDCRNAA